LSAREFGDESLERSAADRVNEEIWSLDQRSIDILDGRVFANEPLTLAELGDLFDVTREAVRQIESRLIKRLRAFLEDSGIAHLARAGLPDGRVVLPLGEVVGETPALGEEVVAVSQPLWRILDRLDDTFEVGDQWWCRNRVAEAIATTKSQFIKSAAGRRTLAIEEVETFLDCPWAIEWIEYCGVSTLSGHALIVSAGIQDRAAVVLEIEGSPLDTDTVSERIGVDRSTRSVRNALSSDGRFSRVDRDSWALSSWGLDTYRSIRTLIANEIDSNGGAVRLSKLIANITDRFSVSGSSIVTYAGSLPFATIDGLVEYASNNATETVPRRSAYETRRLFRHAHSWALRVTVSADHARGSGSSLPSGLIPVLGLKFGESVQLTSRLGDQRISWNVSQLALGSIKRFIDSDDIQVGEVCFLLLHDDGSFDVQKLGDLHGSGIPLALKMAGITVYDEIDGLAPLASAVGLPSGATAEHIAERLRTRGDYDLADALLAKSRPPLDGALL
jgi:hypothetical protein